MLRVLSPGIRAAFVQESMDSKQGKARWNVTYLIVDGGAKVYPVMVLQSGYSNDQQAALDQLYASFRIPGGAPAAKRLATNAELARTWSMSTSSSLNYVTASGAYAGSSHVAYAQSYSMKSDGTYTGSFGGISNSMRIRSKEKGTYRLQGDLLIFNHS